MANKTINGTLTIPSAEPILNGFYPDLTLKLFSVLNNVETLLQTQDVSTSNIFSFTYVDSVEVMKVELFRKSSGALLSESSTRGVLPRSFLVDSTDSAHTEPFISSAYLFDSGLAVLATTGGKHMKLAQEITHGIHLAEQNNSIPFVANHFSPTGATADYRIGTVAVNAYALGFYLEFNPYASNKQESASTLNDILHWLCLKRDLPGFGGLLADGGNVSTVDNIYAYFAFKQAGKVLNAVYNDVANELRTQIINQLYVASTHLFHTGLTSTASVDGDSLEAQVMGSLFWSQEEHFDNASHILDNIEGSFLYVDSVNNLTGYKASTADNQLWFEGTYMVALAYYKMGRTDKYAKIIKPLNRTIGDDGSFSLGIIKDGLYQVLKHESVGATAWAFMTTQVPQLVFTVRENTPLTPGLTPQWINQEQHQSFTRNDCASGTTASTVTYLVLAGQYQSLTSQDDANAQALADIAAHGQTHANSLGTCTAPPAYVNTSQTLTMNKTNCPSGYSGLPYTLSVNAGQFSSDISVDDANAQALAYLQGTLSGYVTTLPESQYCVINQTTVHFWVIPTVDSQGGQDVVYATVYCSFPVATQVMVDVSYTYNGQTYVGGGVSVPAGATNSYAMLLTGVMAGTGHGVVPVIMGITPNSYGNQVYSF